MDPVGALIGSILLGIGLTVLYGAVKNRKVFGASGIIPTALTTGAIADLSRIPEAFPMVSLSPQTNLEKLTDLATGKEQAVWVVPIAVQTAVAHIAETDETLAEGIRAQLGQIDSNTTYIGLVTLAQLLALAEAKGHKEDVDIVRNYIRNLTGESI